MALGARHVVATVEEIPPGGCKVVQIGNRSIGVFNLAGAFYAVRNRCPHQGGPLCSGRLMGLVESAEPGDYRYSRVGEIVQCPWHGWEFDLKTGRSWVDPDRVRTRSYEVQVEDASVETYPVETDRRNVVVLLPASAAGRT